MKFYKLQSGSPDALDIWYYMEGNQPLEIPSWVCPGSLTSPISGWELKAGSALRQM